MLKIVLVEDEKVVLRGMTMALSKEKEIYLAGTAENGTDGLKVIREVKPDLVLTDIRMPGMSGLELIEQAQKEFPNLVFVIFSGFNEFKYVQKAIGLGVLDYLEKPVAVSDLKNVLERARNMIDYKKNYIRLKEQENQVDRVLIEQSLYRLFNQPTEMEKENMEYFLEVGGKLEYSTEFAVLGIGRLLKEDSGSDEYRRLINELTFSIVQKHSFEVYTLSIEEQMFFVYFNQECEEFPFYQEISRARERLEKQDIGFYAGLSNLYSNVYDLRTAFQEARNALNYAVFLEAEDIIRMEDVEYQHSIPSEIGDSQYTMAFNFRLQNYEECFRQVKAYGEYLSKSGLMPEMLRHECIECISQLQQLIAEMGKHTKQELKSADFEKIFTMKSAEEMISWMERLADDYLTLAQQGQASEERPVKIIKKYLDENYAQSITLDTLSELVHMNPTYLSVMFKKEEGISYSNYLVKVRIEKAMELLEKGERAKTVCEKVGYYDYRYFNKQFKKIVGMTPDTYKKSKIYTTNL